MINYILEFSLILCLFGALQFLVFQKVASFNTQRKFIIGGLIASLIIPVLPSIQFTQLDYFTVLLPEVLVTAEGTQLSTTILKDPSSQKIWILFAIISLVFISRWVIGLIKIAGVINRGDKKIIANEPVILTNQITSPCSFFSNILLPRNAQLKDEELRIIIAHEKLHINFNHSIEKITIALAKAIFWWHPVMWFYTRELDLVHEFEVDEAITNIHDKQSYSEILINLLIYPPALRLANPFSSNIKKRIMKMNTQKIKQRPLLLSLALSALVICTIFIHSCSSDDASKTEVILTEKKSDAPNSYMQERVDTITTFDYDTRKETVDIVNVTTEIFKVVEEMPRFPGCDESLAKEALRSCSQQKLMTYIYTNIKYPQEARDAGIEGMVVTRFIVDKNGWIGNITFPRTLGHGLEEAVKNMLDKMQNDIKWVAGKQSGKTVAVEYTLPVKFKLEG